MPRYIDADALRDKLMEYFNHIKKIDKRRTKQLDAICLDVVGAVKSTPTIEVMPRWVPIEQHCPEKGKDVLISHNGVVSIDWLTQSEGVGYFFVSEVAVQDIDAWMPLPESYKAEEVK